MQSNFAGHTCIGLSG